MCRLALRPLLPAHSPSTRSGATSGCAPTTCTPTKPARPRPDHSVVQDPGLAITVPRPGCPPSPPRGEVALHLAGGDHFVAAGQHVEHLIRAEGDVGSKLRPLGHAAPASQIGMVARRGQASDP